MTARRTDPDGLSRRSFVRLGAGAVGLAAVGGCAAAPVSAPPEPSAPRSFDPASFDPWIEIDRAAFRHNAREAARLAGGRPVLAVVKNNAYGLGDSAVGPVLADTPEVGGIACVRVAEAVALREAGVRKPILVMAEGSEAEIAELTMLGALPSVWLDDAPRRLERVARRLNRPVPVQLFIDTGMNREGMPLARARPWIEELARSPSVEIDGTYTMFSHDLDFDRVQLERFEELLAWARSRGIELGTLHASPTVELFHLPEAHYDMVRPGNALFGNYPSGERVRERAELRTTFRLRARVARLERLEPGDSAGFYRALTVERTTWVALLPVGRTDGYPSEANGSCEVLIGGRTYPVRGGVNSAHTLVEIGPERSVDVGDVVTLVGPDHPAVLPHEVASRTERGFLRLIQGMNPRLPRRIV